jgi:alkanesulfonate monooxygenase SsuD/methylene tetrahydromethanopterin reductase-like flavin-dependent oxidoreductase (luciferase family)
MSAYGDEIGVDAVNLMEHHASEDGYLPAPFVLGGGVAARTKRCRIRLGAVILPFHDPVKVAEQLAVLDLMSGGRVEMVLGAGYVPSEFARFGVSLHDRARLMDEGIDIILRALHGERFQANGREVFVRPLPLQTPEEMVLVGGGVAASAKRAARFDLGFSPIQADTLAIYEAECKRLGRAPRQTRRPSPPMSIHLAEDADKGWTLIKPHVAHVVSEYAKLAEGEANTSSPFQRLTNMDALRDLGLFASWTPGELLAKAPLREPGSSLAFMPLLGGLAPEIGWSSLKLLGQVMPQLKR